MLDTEKNGRISSKLKWYQKKDEFIRDAMQIFETF